MARGQLQWLLLPLSSRLNEHMDIRGTCPGVINNIIYYIMHTVLKPTSLVVKSSVYMRLPLMRADFAGNMCLPAAGTPDCTTWCLPLPMSTEIRLRRQNSGKIGYARDA